MKVLKIDYSYYFYPDGMTNLDSFMEYVNKNLNRFIPLVQLLEDNCVEPFFIDTDKVKCYINLTTVANIIERDVTILSKEEYDKRLADCIAKNCTDCESYIEDKLGDNLKGHRNKLRLDGQCDYKSISINED